MMGFIIGLLFNLLILALIVVIVLWVLDVIAKAIGVPSHIYGVIKAIIILLALLIFVSAIYWGGWTFYPIHRP